MEEDEGTAEQAIVRPSAADGKPSPPFRNFDSDASATAAMVSLAPMDERDLGKLVAAHDKELRALATKLIEGDRNGFVASLAELLIGLGSSTPFLGFLANKAVARLLANANDRLFAAQLTEIEAHEERSRLAEQIGRTLEPLLAATLARHQGEDDDRFISMVRILHNLSEEATDRLREELRGAVLTAGPSTRSVARVIRGRVGEHGNIRARNRAGGDAEVVDATIEGSGDVEASVEMSPKA
ncbi:hypothetical protein [Sorangium sp. So ce854]|uniref:hypothetical protein n=1 Tax=Sorangium sp. So ce854 TaxID=3133322 RepID=UPI003F5DFE77